MKKQFLFPCLIAAFAIFTGCKKQVDEKTLKDCC
jgi:hypothetical protein